MDSRSVARLAAEAGKAVASSVVPRLLIRLAFMAGIVCLLFGVVFMAVEAGGRRQPDDISAADLIAKGPPDNLHLRVTDAALVLGEAVQLASKQGKVGAVDYVYVPLASIPSRLGERPALAAVMRMTSAQFSGYRGQTPQGLHLKLLGSLPAGVASRFANIYGWGAVSKACLIDYGREPAGLWRGLGLVALGVAAFAAVARLARNPPGSLFR